jgi:hypothetical protein
MIVFMPFTSGGMTNGAGAFAFDLGTSVSAAEARFPLRGITTIKMKDRNG